MLTIPSALQAKLDSGVTTLAHAWILRRRDGVVQGFTDHDSDLAIAGVTCRAGTGFTASEATARFGQSVDGAELSGALADQSLSEADLAAGRYDAAAVETWLVDWSDVSLRVLTARGHIGEVRREGEAFTAELRGLADLLSQETGRLYTAKCNADVGDIRCRADLTNPAWRGDGVVASLEATAAFTASGLAGFTDGLFTGGRLTWTGGDNAGTAIEIKQHRAPGRLVLWQAMAEPIAVGDAFTVTAGCDKRFPTCRDRFGNAANFRGFPQIPGNDFLLGAPGGGTGGSLGGGRYEGADVMSRHPEALAFFRRASKGDGAEHHPSRLAPDASASRPSHLRMTFASREEGKNMPQPLTRAAVIAEARSWIGTPYRHQASVKGAGCDCLGLVRGVWRGCIGAEPESPGAYAPDWAEATGDEALASAALRHMTPVAVDEFSGGDVLLFRWRDGCVAKHIAIATFDGSMIHAHDGASVCEVTLAPWWRRRLAFAFSFPGVK